MDQSTMKAAAIGVVAGAIGLAAGLAVAKVLEGRNSTSGGPPLTITGSAVHIDSHAVGPHLHSSTATSPTVDAQESPAEHTAAATGGAGATPAGEDGSSLVPVGRAVIGSANRKLSKGSIHVTSVAPVIVGVAGGSGSGKTSIAELITARLHLSRHSPGQHQQQPGVLSISSDNYYKTLPPGTDPSTYNFDHPSSIDFDLLASHLEKLKAGEDIAVPHYDFATHRRTGETTLVDAKRTSVVILDGIFVLWAEKVAAHCDLTIFCSEDLDVCLVRRLRRDIVERKRTVESVLKQYLQFVKAGYEEFVAPSMTKADLIIPRAKENKVAIDMLARDLQRRVDAQMQMQQATAAAAAGNSSGSKSGSSSVALGSPVSSLGGLQLPTIPVAADM